MKALTEPNEEVVLSRFDWALAHGPAQAVSAIGLESAGWCATRGDMLGGS